MSQVAFHTLGCKVNHYETEAIWQLFKAQGYDRVDFESMADVYVINTCTVTNTGDKKKSSSDSSCSKKKIQMQSFVLLVVMHRLPLQKLWLYLVLILL